MSGMFANQDDKAKKTGAKTNVDAKKATDKRREQAVSLRTKNRNEQLTKKRREGRYDDPTSMGGDDGAPAGAAAAGAPTEDTSHLLNATDPMVFTAKTPPAHVPLRLLPQFVELARSTDRALAFHGTLMIRKLLSVDENPPIEEVVASGIVPTLITYLGCNDFVELQFEAAWAVTNVASGTQKHTHYVMEQNAVPYFIQLLASPSEDVREQATWAIGNMAGDSAQCRDYILGLGVMEPLLRCVTAPTSKISVKRNAVWATSNLCRSKPSPALELVAPALPVLAAQLNHHDDEVVTDACWALSYISDGTTDRIQAMLNAGVMPRIVAMLTSTNHAMQTPAIRCVGNVITGTDEQTQVAINAGCLPAFHYLLTHAKRAIKKEAAWTLSNVTAGNVDQIQAVIHANLFPVVMECVYAKEYEVKKEAVWCIANTTSGGTKEQVRHLISCDVIRHLCEVLDVFDVKIVTIALEALENILHMGHEDMQNTPGSTENLYAKMMMDCGGLDKLEALQQHTHNEVYAHALSILEAYFEFEEAAPGGAPVVADASGFGFGGGAGGAAGGAGTFSIA